MIEPQYLHQIKKGVTVKYGNSTYRVQDDGKGFLHIIVSEKGQRKKIGIQKLLFFHPGSLQDYIFNGWFEFYDYDEYKSFAETEMNWI
jgi:hypothetical protein